MKLLFFVKPGWRFAAFGITKRVVKRNDKWNYSDGNPGILYYRHEYSIAERDLYSSFNLERIRRYG